MPTITFTATAQNLNRLVTATCATRGYQPTIDGQPNPQTPAQFAKEWWWNEMKQEVRGYEAREAERTAREGHADLGTG